MKKEDIKNKKTEDLVKELDKNREKLRNFRFAISGSKTKNTKEGRDLRKINARILTEVNNRKNNS